MTALDGDPRTTDDADDADDAPGHDAGDAEMHELAAVLTRLEARFCPPLGPADVHRCAADAVLSLSSARIRRFVALLVERSATERLGALLTEARATPPDIEAAAVAGPPAPARVSRSWWRWSRTTKPSQVDPRLALLKVTATGEPLEG